MTNPRFTIITVCYNAERCIEKTIKSLLYQAFSDYEYIIKDGQSSDSTLKIAYRMLCQHEKAHIISTSDSGIYDAMNEAIGYANGEYVFFLNAGDCFYSSNVLRSVDHYIKGNPRVEIAYGNVILLGGDGHRSLRKYTPICSKSVYAISGDCICHQAMFVKRELFHEKRFDLEYRVCADREWQFFLIRKGKNFGCMNLTIALFNIEGFCKNNLLDYEREALMCVKANFNIFIVIGYKVVAIMKKADLIKKGLRFLGEILFQKSEQFHE